MITLDTHLMSLVNRELVSPDEAFRKAQDPNVMREKFLEARPEAARAFRDRRGSRGKSSGPEPFGIAPSFPGLWSIAPLVPSPSMFPGHSPAIYDFLKEHRLVASDQLDGVERGAQGDGQAPGRCRRRPGIMERRTCSAGIADHLGYDFIRELPVQFPGEGDCGAHRQARATTA